MASKSSFFTQKNIYILLIFTAAGQRKGIQKQISFRWTDRLTWHLAPRFHRNNQKFPVTIDDLAAPSAAILLKTQIFSLTGVPNDRQKIMFKGGLLKDDANLTSLNFKEVNGIPSLSVP